jgi:hypothetical protein
MQDYHKKTIEALDKIKAKIENMSSEEFSAWFDGHKSTDEEASQYAKLERLILGKTNKQDLIEEGYTEEEAE